jgi:hypothetical protein
MRQHRRRNDITVTIFSQYVYSDIWIIVKRSLRNSSNMKQDTVDLYMDIENYTYVEVVLI